MNVLPKFYEDIRYRCKLSDVISRTVSLTRKGAEYLGLCPFHNEKSPSFTLNDAKGFYHCFGCGAHGDVIKFISERYKLSYQEAAIKIAQENGIEIKKLSKREEAEYKEIDDLHSLTSMALDFYKSNITQNVKQYLLSRNIKEELIQKFEIGYAPNNNALYKFLESHGKSLMMMNKAGLVGKDDSGNIYDIFRNRIIFPIKNTYNKVIGFGGRAMLDAMPKYINSPDNILFHKKTSLYAENVVASTCYKTNNIIIVEGYLDAISMHNIGLTQTVASLGTAVTRENFLKILKMVDEVIVCLDGDKAGINATKKLIDNVLDLASTKKIISFIMLPDELDPDSFVRRDGKDAMYKLMESRKSLSETILTLELNKLKDYRPESRALLENNLDDILNKITDKYLKQNFSIYFKNQIWKTFDKHKIAKGAKKLNITIPELISDIDAIEKTMLLFLLKYPKILKDFSVENFFTEIIFENAELERLKTWTLNELSAIIDNPLPNLLEKISDSAMHDLASTMLKDSFMIPALNEDESKLQDFWELLCMKHILIKIKQEYFDILSDNRSLTQQILKGYEDEISRLAQKIDVLTNKILMN
jgi:DNA primase